MTFWGVRCPNVVKKKKKGVHGDFQHDFILSALSMIEVDYINC